MVNFVFRLQQQLASLRKRREEEDDEEALHQELLSVVERIVESQSIHIKKMVSDMLPVS